MQRPGADPDNMQMSDFLCDFCGREWSDTLPLVEGHQGSAICGNCLAVAYRSVVLDEDALSAGQTLCMLCKETRPEPGWQSPLYEDKLVCRRCIKQSAAVLAKDKDLGWKKPTA